MGQRLDLHAILTAIPGVMDAYFQPPESIAMEYPCIVYERDRTNTRFAGDKPYTHTKQYKVTVIDRDPDSDIPDEVAKLPMCSHDRYYAAENLNHDVFTLFF